MRRASGEGELERFWASSGASLRKPGYSTRDKTLWHHERVTDLLRRTDGGRGPAAAPDPAEQLPTTGQGRDQPVDQPVHDETD